MTIRILLVDDHSVVRQGLRMFLSLDPDLEVAGEAANGAEGIEQVRNLKPDVVLMDLLMPVMDGITVIQHLRREFPNVEIIALTSVLEDEKVVGAVRAGAIGYLLKDTQVDELCRAYYKMSKADLRAVTRFELLEYSATPCSCSFIRKRARASRLFTVPIGTFNA